MCHGTGIEEGYCHDRASVKEAVPSSLGVHWLMKKGWSRLVIFPG